MLVSNNTASSRAYGNVVLSGGQQRDLASYDLTLSQMRAMAADFVLGNLSFDDADARKMVGAATAVDALKILETERNANAVGAIPVLTGLSVAEYGDSIRHRTILTFLNTPLPAIAGGANLAVGRLIYTLPAGAQLIDASRFNVGITQTQGNINANAPKVGLGSVIASGVVAALAGTATFMDIMTEQTAANCTGTATLKTRIPTGNVPLLTEEAGSKGIFLNAAAAWSAGGDTGALLNGTVVLDWRNIASS